MTVLEIFSGTRTLSKIADEEFGQEIFTVDADENLNPDLCKDVLYLSLDDIPKEFHKPDYAHFSPPYDCWSNICSNVKNYVKDFIPNRVKTIRMEALIEISCLLIKKLEPKNWTIENPMGGLRTVMKDRRYLQRYDIPPFKRDTVTYCQYGEDRRKPTDIWNNIYTWIPRPKCKIGEDCHQSAPRGSQSGTQGQKNSIVKSKLPDELCREILTAVFNPDIEQKRIGVKA